VKENQKLTMKKRRDTIATSFAIFPLNKGNTRKNSERLKELFSRWEAKKKQVEKKKPRRTTPTNTPDITFSANSVRLVSKAQWNAATLSGSSSVPQLSRSRNVSVVLRCSIAAKAWTAAVDPHRGRSP
jgi:hypothetical protein